MGVSFTDIEDKYNRVFGFIQKDLERILTLETGGNYAVVTLIACSCEALAWYRYGNREGAKVFSRLLPLGPYQTISKTLYNVVRNGFVHQYNAEDILAGGKTIRLAIAWRKHPHLSIKEMDGIPNLVLNVTQLCQDLFNLFSDYRKELETSSDARDHFLTTYNAIGIPKVVMNPAEVAAWHDVSK